MNNQTLQDFEQFQKTLRAFDWVGETKAPGAMDLDCCIEHKGKVLVIEGKPRQGPKVLVSLGQWLTLLALSGKPGISVWLVAEDEEAKTGEGQAQYYVLPITPQSRPHVRAGNACVFYTDGTFTPVTLPELQAMVNEWWEGI